MKKLLIFLAVLLLAGAGYFTYDHWVKNKNLTIWSFVPQNSIFIYESPSPLAILQETKETGIWKNFSTLPLPANLNARLHTLDSIIGQGAFSTSFAESPALISLHSISAEDFDFLFIVEIKNLVQHAYISKIQTEFTKKTRQYLDLTITEIKGNDTNDTFTFIFYKNYFIGSFSAFLVEDAIRAVEDENIIPFSEHFPELQQVSKLEGDQGNVYVNFERYAATLSTFTKKGDETLLAKSAFLDLKINEGLINLSGFTFVDRPNQLLYPFRQQPGASFNMSEVVPNEAATFLHYNFTSGEKLGKDLTEFYKLTDSKVELLRAKSKSENDFDVAYTFNLLDEEIGLVTLESTNADRDEMLLILEIRDMGEALYYFNSAGERDAATKKDSVYIEFFGNYQIRKMPFDNYPYALLGDVAKDFGQAFYLQHRNYLIFSNSLLRLKNLTLAIENENIWSKSLRIRKFMDQMNQSANVSYFVNTSRCWSGFTKGLKDNWSAHADKYQFNYKNVEFLAFQFNSIDDKFYTNFTAFQPDAPDDRFPQKTDLKESITMANMLITKPQLVTNHVTKEKEIAVQDSAYILYQFSSNFDILWSVELNEPIRGDIHQIDYYRNGKLQLAVATPSAIHIIDRNGEYIPGFPKPRISENPIEFFKPVDYDNSKNYRYAIGDTKGQLFLTDKDMKPLEGWSPKRFSQPLAETPAHYRIGGRDIFVVLLKSGEIHAFNRKGELLKGFPVDLQSNMSHGFFVKESNDLQSSILYVMTESGEQIQLSLLGEIKSRNQFYKPTSETVFKILPNVAKTEFVIVRQTENKYEVLNEVGTLLFAKDYFSGKPLFYQYYNLGADTRLIVFVDPIGAYLYIYDLAGNLITGRPLSATRPISLWKNGNEFQIYRCVDQNLELITLTF